MLPQSNESVAFSCYMIFNCIKGVLSSILVLLRNVWFPSQAAISHSNPIFPWMNTLIKMSLWHFFLHEITVLFLRRQQQGGRNAEVGYGKIRAWLITVYCWNVSMRSSTSNRLQMGSWALTSSPCSSRTNLDDFNILFLPFSSQSPGLERRQRLI